MQQTLISFISSRYLFLVPLITSERSDQSLTQTLLYSLLPHLLYLKKNPTHSSFFLCKYQTLTQ
ncbi:hypothetical protein HanPSC8_Chr01g0023741 [Helianthus annuus]|nr:hypothetical protein HanPSC8_Chr01g0023741 [Helianthus annuus]